MVDSLQMQTYGGYVWSCYGLTLVALVWLAYVARRRWQDALLHARRRTDMSRAGHSTGHSTSHQAEGTQS